MERALKPSSCLETDASVVCAKCRHPNPESAEHCASCGKHLFIYCHECGQRNPRGNSRCDQCHVPLHHNYVSPPPSYKLHWPYCWNLDPNRKWLIPAQVASLLTAAVLVALFSVNILDYFNGAERYFFPDLFNEYPILMPRRYLYAAHILTACAFLLPLGLGGLLFTWLARQTKTPPQARS